MILDNYNNILKKYMNLLYDSNISVSENWDNFFGRIDTWKTKYLINSDKFRLYGVSGWWWEIFYCKFIACDEADYIAIISLICWSIQFESCENTFYKNHSFLSLAENNFTVESLTNLTKDNFLDELSNMNQKSHKGFEDYVECYEKTYPIIIEKLTSEYQRFMKFFDDFKSDFQGGSVFRINDLGEDEIALYFIKEGDYTHVILMEDFV